MTEDHWRYKLRIRTRSNGLVVWVKSRNIKQVLMYEFHLGCVPEVKKWAELKEKEGGGFVLPQHPPCKSQRKGVFRLKGVWGKTPPIKGPGAEPPG